MKVCQRLDGRPRSPKRQRSAGGRVQHPAGYDYDNAGRHLDVDHLTAGSALAVLALYSAAVKRMPTVVDLDFLPDMGRMTLRWHSGGRTGCSPAVFVRASGPQRS